MDEPSLSEADERNLRFLRILVLVLTTTMIVGMGLLVYLFATRLGGPDGGTSAAAGFVLPDTLDLPDGATVQAVTRGKGWWAVVTEQGEILIFDDATGTLRQRVVMEE